jgi:hypothetical protein
VGVELFYAEGETDGRAGNMEKLIVVFRNFANTPEKVSTIKFIGVIPLRGMLSIYLTSEEILLQAHAHK